MNSSGAEPVRVLVVDDDPSIVRLIKSILERREQSHLIITATTEPQYVWGLAAEGCVDICITDMDMPTVNGFRLLKELKEINPLTQVIFMTAHPTIAAGKSAFAMGVNEFLSKPINMDDMQHSVQFLANRVIRLRKELSMHGLNESLHC